MPRDHGLAHLPQGAERPQLSDGGQRHVVRRVHLLVGARAANVERVAVHGVANGRVPRVGGVLDAGAAFSEGLHVGRPRAVVFATLLRLQLELAQRARGTAHELETLGDVGDRGARALDGFDLVRERLGRQANDLEVELDVLLAPLLEQVLVRRGVGGRHDERREVRITHEHAPELALELGLRAAAVLVEQELLVRRVRELATAPGHRGARADQVAQRPLDLLRARVIPGRLGRIADGHGHPRLLEGVLLVDRGEERVELQGRRAHGGEEAALAVVALHELAVADLDLLPRGRLERAARLDAPSARGVVAEGQGARDREGGEQEDHESDQEVPLVLLQVLAGHGGSIPGQGGAPRSDRAMRGQTAQDTACIPGFRTLLQAPAHTGRRDRGSGGLRRAPAPRRTARGGRGHGPRTDGHGPRLEGVARAVRGA